MNSTLYLCRLPWQNVAAMAANPHIRKAFPTIVASHQVHPTEDPGVDRYEVDYAVPEKPTQTRKFIRRMLIRNAVSHVVASQKLLWYSDILQEQCDVLGVKLIWSEPFFDGRCIFDQSGLPYTKVNDLCFDESFSDNLVAACPPQPIKQTREAQPAECHLSGFSGNEVVIFGQVPWDMALRDYPGLNYRAWLKDLVGGHQSVLFLFKHHPKAQTPYVPEFENLLVVDASIDWLFEKFQTFAAFSSTTILEGTLRGKENWITAGNHFLSGILPSFPKPGSDWLLEMVQEVQNHDRRAMKRRLAFVTNAYTLPLDGKAVALRLTTESHQFFAEKLWI